MTTKVVNIKGFLKLSDEQKEMFLRTHARHLRAMGTENQKKYALEDIKKVVWDKEEQAVNVYFEDTWWHYDKRGCWY